MKSKEENNIKDIYDRKTKNYNELTSNILKNYSNKVLELNNFLEIADVLTEMIDDINNAFEMNIVSGEEILVKNTLRYLMNTNDEYKKYELDKDKMTWLIKTFHDNYFDYDTFEKDVILSLEETMENYYK